MVTILDEATVRLLKREQLSEVFKSLNLTPIMRGWFDEVEPPMNKDRLYEAANRFIPHMEEGIVYYNKVSSSAVYLSTKTGEFKATCPLYFLPQDQGETLIFV